MHLDPAALRLLDEIVADRSVLAARIVAKLRRALPEYRGLAPDTVQGRVEHAIELVTDALRGEPDAGGTAAFVTISRAQAQDGVDATLALRAVRLAMREAMSYAEERVAATAELDGSASFALSNALWDWVEAVADELVPAGVPGNEPWAREVAEQRLVTAAVRAAPAAELAQAADRCGFDIDGRYLVVRAAAGDQNDAAPLPSALRPGRPGSGAAGRLDGQVVALLSTPPSRRLAFPAGAGTPGQLSSAPLSYRQAGRALQAATRFGYTGLFTLEELGLRVAVAHDQVIGEMLAGRYLHPLLARGSYGAQLLDSIRAYFASDHSVDETAKELFVHPNTLRYRLSRFEALTGCSLRNPANIAEIWWVLAYAEM